MAASTSHRYMARLACIVFPGYPHHVVHRGNLRAQVCFSREQEIASIRLNIAPGGPTTPREFAKQLEREAGRPLTPQPRGRKLAASANVIDLTEDMFG